VEVEVEAGPKPREQAERPRVRSMMRSRRRFGDEEAIGQDYTN
jgi:hypothetical protein